MSYDETIKSVLAALIIVFSWGLAGTAMAEQDRLSGAVWLWSDSSPKSNAAATAFGDGNMVRGLRLAHSALESATDRRDRLIAHHNLCVAHAARAKTQRALKHCQATRRLADSSFVVAQGSERLTALNVLDANLSRLGATALGKLP